MSGQALEFLLMMGKLKQLQRTGWVRCQVKKSESVADHMYRMSVMAFFLKTPDGLDRDKCIKMALVHDMAESIVGDITPHCGIAKEEKRKREMKAMLELQELAGDAGHEMYSLWEEYENQASAEAKAVKDLDRFDMVLQAYEYEKQEDRAGQLQEFFDSTTDKINHPVVLKWLQDLEKERKLLATKKIGDN